MTRDTPAWIGISVLLAAASYFAYTHGIDGARSLETDAVARLSSGVALLIVITGSAFFGYRRHVTPAVKLALAWFALALGVVVVFAYRVELIQVAGAALGQPAHATSTAVARTNVRPTVEGSQIAISAGRGGHFFVEALVNGTHTRFVADTGATLVALTFEDAERIGIDVDSLEFSKTTRTANGLAKLAFAMVDEMRVGPITIRDVPALIAPAGLMSDNLLGMSFLKKLSSFHIRGDQLILRQ